MKQSDASTQAGRKARRDAGESDKSAEKRRRFSLTGIIPQQNDPRRPPLWLPTALLMCVVAVFLAIWTWGAFSQLQRVIVDLIICFFLAMAIEPAVLFLIRHGWKRGVAALVVWIGVLVIICLLVWLFGQMFVQQVVGLVGQLPDMYSQLGSWVSSHTPWKLPKIADLGTALSSSFSTKWVSDLAGTAVATISSATNVMMSLMIILFVTYYVSASGPRFRKSICSLLRPSGQRTFLVVWDVISGQISSFLSSRVVLAAISAVCMSIFMVAVNVPYWLPMAVLYAIISQFVPMVGGIIGAILPVIVTLSDKGVLWAVIMVAYVTVYQQIENMLIAPRVQQQTMDVNPAVGLVAVFAFGDVFGFLGSFLALPVVASIQVIISAYTMRQELVSSPLLDDPKPQKKSKVVEASEKIGERLNLGRHAAGSSSRAPRSTREQLLASAHLYDVTTSIPITSAGALAGDEAGEKDVNGSNAHERQSGLGETQSGEGESSNPDLADFHTDEQMDESATIAIVKRPSLRRQWERGCDESVQPSDSQDSESSHSSATSDTPTDQTHRRKEK